MIKFLGRAYDHDLSTWLETEYSEYSIATVNTGSFDASQSRVDGLVLESINEAADSNIGFKTNYLVSGTVMKHIRVCLTSDTEKNYIEVVTGNGQGLFIFNYNNTCRYINQLATYTTIPFYPYSYFAYDVITINDIKTQKWVEMGSLYYSTSRNSYSAYRAVMMYDTLEIAKETIFDLIALNPVSDDPAFWGDNSTTGGGKGLFTLTSDSVDFQTPPALSAVSAGFISIYAPTLAQLNSLATYMWSQTFIDAILKLFSDPMQAILGLSIVPVTVPIGVSENIKVGFIDTGISCNKASSQYVTFDCGTLTPAEYWGSALDYSPYTKFTVFLPFIGSRELDTIDVMGKSIQVKYNIDILSGSCTVMIKCDNAVKYQFSGSCASSIPVTGRDFTNLLTSAIQLASIAGTTVTTGGASAAGLVSATANAVAAMRPNIQRGSAVSGSAGLLGIQKPYLIWELPKQSLAKDYNKFIGYPSNITALLSTLTGFTQIESIRLSSIAATDDEKAEIETLLKEGVIL